MAVAIGLAVAPLSAPHLHGAAARETVRLVTLEWPPFASQTLPSGGVAIELVERALSSTSFRLEVDFMPWKRALDRANVDPAVIGILPIYEDNLSNRLKGYFLSKPLLESPLLVVSHQDKPVDWTNLTDLRPYLIGTVAGYKNEPEFDAMAAQRALRTEEVPDDISNLRKLAARRIDAAIIDAAVFQYLIDSPEGRSLAPRLRASPRPLAYKSLHIAFRDDDLGHRANAALEEGLKGVDPLGLLARYLSQF